MDANLLQLLGNYGLAGIFVILFIRSQMELVKVHREMADQRREENKEMRTLLFQLARRGVRTSGEDSTQIQNAYHQAMNSGGGGNAG